MKETSTANVAGQGPRGVPGAQKRGVVLWKPLSRSHCVLGRTSLDFFVLRHLVFLAPVI